MFTKRYKKSIRRRPRRLIVSAKLQKNKKHFVARSLSTTSSVPRKPAAQQWLPRPHHLVIPSTHMGCLMKVNKDGVIDMYF